MENVIEFITPFTKKICSIDEEKKTLNEINHYFADNPSDENKLMGRVWILIGREDSVYYSLMVAQSEDINVEIVNDVRAMFNLEYKEQKAKQNNWDKDKEIKYNLDVIQSPQIAKINSNDNYFVFPKGSYKKKSQYLYRYIKKRYKDLMIYEVIIDSYLNYCRPEYTEPNMQIAYDFGKDYLAEAKLAVETKSLFWNYYKSGIGKRAYFHYRKLLL